MHHSPAVSTRETLRLRGLWVAITSVVIACFSFVTAEAAGPRIWVDAEGLFSIEATLVEIAGDRVVLLRRDGGKTKIKIDKLSIRDQEYVEEITNALDRSPDNPLRLQPPERPETKPLAILDLPPADEVAEEGSFIQLGSVTSTSLSTQLPKSLPADRSPWSFAVAKTRIPILKVDNYDNCSRPLPMTVRTETGTRRTAIAMSVSRGLWIPGEAPRHQLIRFDADDGRSVVTLEHDDTIKLLDHHEQSNRSLLLVGHNSLGEGGELQIGTGWGDGNIQLHHRRKLSKKKSAGGKVPHLRWARWVDDEHFLAVIDQTLGLWNIVSGDQVYRMDGIHYRAGPAISGGRRYVAVPFQGSVQLFETRSGKPIGRIRLENQVPSVSFSPDGSTLAIATTRRLRNWDLRSASLSADIESRRGLGNGQPVWINSDLVLSSSGVLLSVFRGLPIWRYDLSSSETVSVGKHLAMFRKHPVSELSIVSLPHQGAVDAMHWIDNSPTEVRKDKWRILGRSDWKARGGWTDHDVQVSALPALIR